MRKMGMIVRHMLDGEGTSAVDARGVIFSRVRQGRIV